MKLFNTVRSKKLEQSGFSHIELFFGLVFVGLVAFVGIRVLTASHAATNCTIDSNLVNSCRAWQGVSPNKYPGVTTSLRARVTDFETRTGASMDFVHDFSTAGQTLSADDIYYINRPNTYLLLNYKPSFDWASADGSNASVNAGIDAMANSIKAQGSKKVLFNVWHEPENDVSGGAASCPSTFTYVGTTGTPAQYRAMWQNVRNRFDALGVNNVVWSVIYMSGAKWDCMQKEMWPGNGLVDWVMWDHYYSNTETFNSGTSRFYNWLTANTDVAHAYTSKPWGIGEWGSWKTNQSDVYQLYTDGGKALTANTFPNIKLWTLWDSIGSADSRVQYTSTGVKDQNEQDVFNLNWAKNAAFTGTVSTGGGDTIAPTVSITSPTTDATVTGSATVNVNASDNVNVTRVVITDGTTVIHDATSQGTYGWGSVWDSTKSTNGSHTLTTTAYDAAGNHSASSVVVTVSNAVTDRAAPSISFTNPTDGSGVNGTVLISVNAADNVGVTRVVISDGTTVIRDATSQDAYGWGASWDTSPVKNGHHTLTATAYDAAGNTSTATISVTVKGK